MMSLGSARQTNGLAWAILCSTLLSLAHHMPISGSRPLIPHISHPSALLRRSALTKSIVGRHDRSGLVPGFRRTGHERPLWDKNLWSKPTAQKRSFFCHSLRSYRKPRACEGRNRRAEIAGADEVASRGDGGRSPRQSAPIAQSGTDTLRRSKPLLQQ